MTTTNRALEVGSIVAIVLVGVLVVANIPTINPFGSRKQNDDPRSKLDELVVFRDVFMKEKIEPLATCRIRDIVKTESVMFPMEATIEAKFDSGPRLNDIRWVWTYRWNKDENRWDQTESVDVDMLKSDIAAEEYLQKLKGDVRRKAIELGRPDMIPD